MVTLRFIFSPRLPGRSVWVRVIVNGEALIVTTLANARGYI